MVTGDDEKRAATLEQNAANAEQKKQQLEARLNVANEDAARTGEQVKVAERRLAVIRNDLQQQRERLAGLRASATSGPSVAEAARLQNEVEAIERERRAAQDASNTVTPATLRGLEDRTRAVGKALDRLSAI
jgi:chromosome segregation ATPase